jgi:hypothetical protein
MSAGGDGAGASDEEVDNEWRKDIEVGMQLDVYDQVAMKWQAGKIQEQDDDFVQVHFMGWNSTFDEWMDKSDERLSPQFTHTAVKKKWNSKLTLAEEKANEEEGVAVEVTKKVRANNENAHFHRENVVVGETKSGRQVKGQIIVAQTTAKRESVVDLNDWLCTVCNECEGPSNDLLCCEGTCLRTFHKSCLESQGLSAPADDDDGDWLCKDCTDKSHECFVCHKRGKDNSAVFKCSIHACGKYYHKKCLKGLEHADISANGSFKCPHHVCHTCNTKGSRCLLKCFKCPVAYHMNCCPPSVRFNEVCLFCSKHPDVVLPKEPASFDDEEEMVVEENNEGSEFKFPPLKFKTREPDVTKKRDNHFRMESSIVTEVENRPAPFVTIKKSIYCCKPNKQENVTFCQCVGSCGERCINRLMDIECIGNGQDLTPAAKGTKRVSSNCNVGAKCGNRRIQNYEYAQTELAKTPGKGWGLNLTKDLEANDLVIEYVGEIIDETKMEARLEAHRKCYPKDANMYVMELSHNAFIDGRLKGNVARYINHSCEPNCILKRWDVGGYLRIGIMALDDIPAGTELSYDYQFSTEEVSRFKCMCGTKRCRGTLAGKVSIEARHAADGTSAKTGKPEKKRKMGKKERQELLKRARLMEKQIALKESALREQTLSRMSLTGMHFFTICFQFVLINCGHFSASTLPGDITFEVVKGPPPNCREVAQERRLFKWSNARRGFDFTGRLRLLEKTAEQ